MYTCTNARSMSQKAWVDSTVQMCTLMGGVLQVGVLLHLKELEISD